MMRRIILLLVLLFFANLSYSQKVFRKGIIVKGKEVTYQVLASKQASFYYLVRNVNNPDTTLKPIPQRSVYTAQERDMELQIAEIVHENLSPGELDSLKFDGDFAVVLRNYGDCFSLRVLGCPSSVCPHDCVDDVEKVL